MMGVKNKINLFLNFIFTKIKIAKNSIKKITVAFFSADNKTIMKEIRLNIKNSLKNFLL